MLNMATVGYLRELCAAAPRNYYDFLARLYLNPIVVNEPPLDGLSLSYLFFPKILILLLVSSFFAFLPLRTVRPRSCDHRVLFIAIKPIKRVFDAIGGILIR